MNEIHPKVFEVAKERFRMDYEKSYPQPVKGNAEKPTMSAFWENPMVWVDMVVIIAATFMSALRTFHVLHTVGSSLEGFAGIIVIEGVAGFITFFLVLQSYRENHKVANKIAGWMQALVLASIALALLTNIYSMMIYQDATLSAVEWLLFILAGSIAVFAIAVLSHILGTLYVQNLDTHEKAMEWYKQELQAIENKYQESMREWADEFERQWRKPTNQNRFVGMVNSLYQNEQGTSAVGVSSPQRTTPVNYAVSNLSIDNTRQVDSPTMGFGYIAQSSVSSPQRTTPVFDSVYQEFVNNPDLAKLSLRVIQSQLETKASVETINQARRQFLANNS